MTGDLRDEDGVAITRVCVGAVQQVVMGGRQVGTGYLKQPVERATLGIDGFTGDEQEYVPHQNPDRAVLSYATAHYDFWRDEHGIPMPEHAAFGENLLTEGLTEEDAHIGDVYSVGTAVIQVSEPRGPCYKIDLRHDRPRFNLLVNETCRTGILYRVLTPGAIAPGDRLRRLSREDHGFSVLQAHLAITGRSDEAEAEALLAVDSLADASRRSVRKRLDRAAARRAKA